MNLLKMDKNNEAKEYFSKIKKDSYKKYRLA
jgi:hypothetical protein